MSGSKSGTWSTSAKASWSFSGTFSWSASSSTSGSSSSAPKKTPRKTPLPSYNVPDTVTDSHEPKLLKDEEASTDSTQPKPSKDKETTTDSTQPKPPKDQSGPTIEEPFNFIPTDSATFTVVECSDDEDEEPQMIAIPQIAPTSTSPFLTGYPPSLDNHGISKATWASFLDTVSGFLEATVSQQAINHAVDVAAHIGKRPKKLAGNLVSRTASIGQEIGDSAKRGNVVGVTAGIIKGAVSLPLNLVMTTTSAVLGLPITAALAASKKPLTPRQRATAYLAVANEKWLVPRKLFAGLIDTKELGDLLGTPISGLPVVEEQDENGVKQEETQYNALRGRVESLETWGKSSTQVGAETLWLVVTQVVDS